MVLTVESPRYVLQVLRVPKPRLCYSSILPLLFAKCLLNLSFVTSFESHRPALPLSHSNISALIFSFPPKPPQYSESKPYHRYRANMASSYLSRMFKSANVHCRIPSYLTRLHSSIGRHLSILEVAVNFSFAIS